MDSDHFLLSFKYLVGKTIDRPEPKLTDIEKEFGDALIPTFRTAVGATLERTSAIQLLNRYGQTMPNDIFTNGQVIWNSMDTNDGVVVTLMLPIQSVVRDVVAVRKFVYCSMCAGNIEF